MAHPTYTMVPFDISKQLFYRSKNRNKAYFEIKMFIER